MLATKENVWSFLGHRIKYNINSLKSFSEILFNRKCNKKQVFHLNFKQPNLPIPPGMEIAAIVEFECTNAQEYSDKMVISIDNREIEIPIHAYPAKPSLVFDGKYI